MSAWARLTWLVLGAGLAAAAPSGETLSQRQARVEKMSEAEKAELGRRWSDFRALTAEEREALRSLHAQLSADPDAVHLRAVMERYSQWYASLPSFRRTELGGLSPEERIKRIKALLQEQSARGARRPSPEEVKALLTWLERNTARHEKEILQSMPETMRSRLGELSPPQRTRVLMWWRWQAAGPGRPAPLSKEEMTQLRAALPSESRAKLESKSLPEQWHIVMGWLRHAARQQPEGAGTKGMLWLVDEQELSRFFEQGISEEQRDRLLSLPADEMQRELRILYYRQQGKPVPSDFSERWPGGGFGRRPGIDGMLPRKKFQDRGPPPPGSSPGEERRKTREARDREPSRP
jgi:hypothetical protein